MEKENRTATPEERAVLKNYSGFGGIKAVLNPVGHPGDERYWTKSDLDLFGLVTELHEVLREGAGDETQYKRYVSSLKNSILTAFYTPTEVVNVLVETLHKRGITPMRLLDPSAGMGAFASAFRQQFPDCENTCFEKDLLTGKILSQLCPKDNVRTEGFENIESRYTNHYDIATSNIPFGDVAVYDPFIYHSITIRHGVWPHDPSTIISFSNQSIWYALWWYRGVYHFAGRTQCRKEPSGTSMADGTLPAGFCRPPAQ